MPCKMCAAFLLDAEEEFCGGLCFDCCEEIMMDLDEGCSEEDCPYLACRARVEGVL